MSELLPILSGIVMGMLIGFLRPSVRILTAAALTVALGAIATIASGEYTVSWAFLLVDVPLVGISAVAGLLACRIALRSARRPTGPR